MREDRLFEEGTVPEYCTASWYAERESAPHVDQDLHRPRLELAAQMVMEHWRPDYTVVDLGAGDGGLLSLLPPHVPRWGYDLQQSNVDAARDRDVRVILSDVVAGGLTVGHITVCTEMLEHLVDPHAFVRRIRIVGAEVLVASSPWTETREAHYGYHTWAWDVEGYAAMIERNGWRVVRHETTGMFQVLAAVGK